MTDEQQQQYSKAAVGYQARPMLGQECLICTMWLGKGKCSAVEGRISPSGWCQLWSPEGKKSDAGKRQEI